MYLTLREAGRRMNVSGTQVARIIDKGLIVAYRNRASGRRCVREIDVEEYLASFKPIETQQQSAHLEHLKNAN